MKLNEIAAPIDRHAHENRRQDAIKAVVGDYKRGRLARQAAAQQLTSRGLGPQQIQTLLGPEKRELGEDDDGHEIISTPRLVRIIMHLTELMRQWRSHGHDQPANDLRGVLRQHGLMESSTVDEHYKKIKAGQIAKIDKQIADTEEALKTNKHAASRASMKRNLEDLEGEKDRISKHYKDKHGVAEAMITKRSLRGDAQRSGMAQKAIDLAPYLNRIRDEGDFEKKKALAIDMARHFAVGGREKFITSIALAKTPNDVDRIAYGADMKGRGMGTKIY